MAKRKRDLGRTSSEDARPNSKHFPLLELPAEIRNLIYQHCFSVDRNHLRFSLGHSTVRDANTALLSVNKQVYAEAMPILYSGSMSISISYHTAVPFREDQATRGNHSLRNGRQVSMTSFTGRIYPHVFARFRKIILVINVLYLLGTSIDTMVESPRLQAQIEVVLEALKPTLQSSFMGPKLQELKIVTDKRKAILRALQTWENPRRVVQLKRRQKRLLMPFSQLFGLKRVQIIGVSDQAFVHEFRRIMEGDGPGSNEAKQSLMRMVHTGNQG